VVDGITGGTALTAGRHVDDTVKYAVNPEVIGMNVAANVIEAHRAKVAEKEEMKRSYWEQYQPGW
jgi:hypothetical protein